MLAHGYIHGLLAPRQDGLAEGPAEESCLGHGGQEAESKEGARRAPGHAHSDHLCSPGPASQL